MENRKWTRNELIALTSVLIAIVAAIATLLTVPAIHSRFFGGAQSSETDDRNARSSNVETIDTSRIPSPITADNNSSNSAIGRKDTATISTDDTTTSSPFEQKDTIISLPATIFKPPHVGSGDGNLNTSADNPFSYHVEGKIEVVSHAGIRSRVFIRVRETKGDHTAGEGWSPWRTEFEAENGWEIAGVKPLQPAAERGSYNRMSGFGIDNLNPKEVVRQFWIKGDRYGNDIPNYLELQVTWRPVKIMLLRQKE